MTSVAVAAPARRPLARGSEEPDGVVTLIRPPVVVMPGSLATHGPTPPIGLAYLAAALRAGGHRVALLDSPGLELSTCVEFDSPVGPLHRIGMAPEDLVARIDPETRVIGITNMFLHEWPQVREIAGLARARFPDATILVGGENATAFSKWILEECPAIDHCVLGEGESTLLQIMAMLREGLPLDDLDGVRGRVGPSPDGPQRPPRMTKAELAEIPWPAWDLVDLDSYWSHEPFFGVDRGRAMQVLGTRGCPYKCSFCSSQQMWTTRFVVREPSDVVDEIETYVDRYGIRNVNFVDLTAATNRRWTVGFCDELEDRNLDITWQLPVGTRTESMDREVLQRLHDTGCRNVTFAPESGSQRMLEVMDKRADLDHILELVSAAHEIGLRSTVNIIVGHPEERWSDTLASLRFLGKAALRGGDDTAVIMFCPYPGSRDYEALVRSGRHEIDEAALYVGLSRSSRRHRSWNPRQSARAVRAIQFGLLAAFYGVAFLRRPSRIVQFLKGMFGRGSEETYLDQMIRTKRKPIPVSKGHPSGSSGAGRG